jgi:hypothetical protein
MSSKMAERLVRVCVVLWIVVTGFFAWQVQDLSSCVANYNDLNNTRAKVLTEASDQERDAERKADDAQAALFLDPAVSKPMQQRTPAEQAELLRLFRAYQSALSDQKKERADADGARRVHPIPDPPREVCG